MQGWIIAFIVIGAVIFVFAAALIIGSIVATKKILGRVDSIRLKGEAGDYGVDKTWFDLDDIKANTEKLKLVAYDGTDLVGLLIKHPDGAKRVAICQHGYTASPVSVQPYAKMFYDKGYDVLLPYARAHWESGGKYVGMAWLDRFDTLRWVDRIIELYGRDVSIVMHGVSMGGATVVAASGMNPPPQVKCVIDDCGFASQYDEYSSQIEHIHLPNKLILLPLEMGVRMVQGYSIYDADIARLAANTKLPIMFIHCDRDTFVPYAQCIKLYDACGSDDKEFVTFENAAHAASYVSDKERYVKIVTEFVDRVMG